MLTSADLLKAQILELPWGPWERQTCSNYRDGEGMLGLVRNIGNFPPRVGENGSNVISRLEECVSDLK